MRCERFCVWCTPLTFIEGGKTKRKKNKKWKTHDTVSSRLDFTHSLHCNAHLNKAPWLRTSFSCVYACSVHVCPFCYTVAIAALSCARAKSLERSDVLVKKKRGKYNESRKTKGQTKIAWEREGRVCSLSKGFEANSLYHVSPLFLFLFQFFLFI